MSTRNDGGEAFPRSKGSNEYAIDHGAPGMSLRAYLAGQAIAGQVECANPSSTAEWAVQLADAVIAELNKP